MLTEAMAEGSRRRLVAVGVVLVLAGSAVAVWLAGGFGDACGPATAAQADAAHRKFVGQYITGADHDEVIQGAGISKDDDSFVLLVLVLPGGEPADAPDCVDGVPVRYEPGGPFTGD
jgi:hypothetical protein